MKKLFFAIWAFAIPVFAHAQTDGSFARGIFDPGANAMLPAVPISLVLANAMRWLLSIVGFIAIIAFVVSGIMYLTAAGDESQAERAKKTAKYALIGLIVALGGIIVIEAVKGLLSGDTRF